ncbi:MAG: hypothetical protein ACK478_08070 [Flavobacteriales bacterium]|jgi:iron complex outermembrane receptor protein
MKKLIVLIAGIVWSACACAQATDTISGHHQTDDVIIVARASDFWGAANVVTPLKRRQWLTGDVGSFLDAHGLAHQLTAGAPGAAGSLRFHGLSSDHTLLSWQGLPLNSMTLGTCDVSLLPMFFFELIRVSDNPAHTGAAQQGMGTTIQLGNGPFDETSASAHSAYNSLGNHMLGAQAQYSKSTNGRLFSTRVRAFRQGFENRYRYVDRYRIDKPMMWQEHQQGEYMGSQAELDYSHNNRALSFRTWWQQKSMELPQVMGTASQGSATQDDATLRSMLEYRWWKPRLHTYFQLAHTYEKLHYVDEPVAIDSDIRSQMLWANGYAQWLPFTGFQVKVSTTQAAVRVMNTNYTDGRLDKPWSQYALQMHYRKGPHEVEGNTSFEQRFGSEGWSYSLSYRIFHHWNRNSLLSPLVNIARRYRLPDMNELFWTPGGNPNLRPELGYHGKAGLTWSLGKEKRTQWRIEPTVFVSRVLDWIQWVPQDNGVWSPVNFLRVQTQGAELFLLCEKLSKNDRTRYRFETRWTLNDVFNMDSLSRAEERRMIYSPRYIGYQGASIQRTRHSASIGYRFVSDRFTDEVNTPHRALTAYGLCNLWYGVKFNKNDLDIDLTAGVDNVFDVAYETLRAYAMPGRVWRIGLSCSFIQKKPSDGEIKPLLD